MNEIGPVLPRQAEPGPARDFSRSTAAGWAKGRLRRRILFATLLLAAAVSIAIGLMDLKPHPGDVSRAAEANSAVPLVTTAPVELRPMVRALTVTGSLVARNELPVGAEISGGRIDAVLVDEGDHVAKGQVLARLDHAVLDAQLRHAQATVQEAAAAAASAEADFKRVDSIRGTGAVSSEQVGQRRAAAASAAARLAAAKAQISELEARLDQTILRAPADGVIVVRNAEPGGIVSAGGAPLFRLIEGGLVEFDAQVPQDQLLGLKPGLKAEINLQAAFAGADFIGAAFPAEDFTGGSPTGDTTITGRIRAIAPTLDPQSRLGIVHIALPVDPRLRPGAFVQGHILLSNAAVLLVPLSAVLWEHGLSYVYVVPGAHAQRRIVQTGAMAAGRVEIRSGLSRGDPIILSAGAFLHDGTAVRKVAPAAEPAGAGEGASPE